MKILITGGCGFVGSNLAARGQDCGHDITVLDNLYRLGAELNLEWLQKRGNIKFVKSDIRDKDAVEELLKSEKYDGVFHLAGQVAMTTSLKNPRFDFEVNALGTFNLLDAIRQFQPNTPILYSSTNKVYGDLEQFDYEEISTRYICKQHPNGFDENVPIDMHSPYGCSKGTADQYVLDFSRMFGIKGVVFRHSSMYGGRQFATYDQGWVEWFCHQALNTKNNPENSKFTISGNGKQVRDILHCNDVVELYYTALEHIEIVKGKAFNIGGGIEQSLSILELFNILEDMLDVKLTYQQLPPRESDQLVFVSNNSKIESFIPWKPKVTIEKGIQEGLKWAMEVNK